MEVMSSEPQNKHFRRRRRLQAIGRDYHRAIDFATSAPESFSEVLLYIYQKLDYTSISEGGIKKLRKYWNKARRKLEEKNRQKGEETIEDLPLQPSIEEEEKRAAEIKRQLPPGLRFLKPERTPAKIPLEERPPGYKLEARGAHFLAAMAIAAKAPPEFGQVLEEVRSLCGEPSNGARRMLQTRWREALNKDITRKTNQECRGASVSELWDMLKDCGTSGPSNQLRRRIIRSHLKTVSHATEGSNSS